MDRLFILYEGEAYEDNTTMIMMWSLIGGRHSLKSSIKTPRSKSTVKTAVLTKCIFFTFKRDEYINCLN